MTDNAELLPCPFCGGEATASGHITYAKAHEAWFRDGSQVLEAYYVNCLTCGADNKALLGHQTRKQSIAAWNTRAPVPASYPVVEEGIIERARAYAEEHYDTGSVSWCAAYDAYRAALSKPRVSREEIARIIGERVSSPSFCGDKAMMNAHRCDQLCAADDIIALIGGGE